MPSSSGHLKEMAGKRLVAGFSRRTFKQSKISADNRTRGANRMFSRLSPMLVAPTGGGGSANPADKGRLPEPQLRAAILEVPELATRVANP